MSKLFRTKANGIFTDDAEPLRSPIRLPQRRPTEDTTDSKAGDGNTGDGPVTIQAVTASFSAATGVLSVFGDAADNTLTISRNAAGNILVNGGAVQILGGTPSVANTSMIQVFGLSGNDRIVLDESNGALPRATLFGGAGNDSITGGSGNDMLFGQGDNDILSGKGGTDMLFGGAGNDTLTGGDGDDLVFGESGDDRMIWNAGDDTDLFEGGAGIDTAEVNGGNGAEQFTVTANGARVRFDRLSPAPFSLDIGTTENLVLNAGGGDDVFSATGNLAALIKLTIDGGAGNDTISGGNGADVLLGGSGNDTVDGNQGNDVALLGTGNDKFVWDPGDGSDVVEGQAGFDTLDFNGSAGNEIMQASANGQRVLFTRNLGSIAMDLNGVERIEIDALGGADQVIVNDLTGTDVTKVDVNLAGVIGGTAGDSQIDNVIVNGTNAANTITVQASGTSATVLGLSAQVSVTNAEGIDQLTINGLGGNDVISAATVASASIKLVLDGGAGNDTVTGGAGNDLLLGGGDNDVLFGQGGHDTMFGGDGNDTLVGGDGDDLMFGEAGDDRFIWNPGDDTDLVEGGEGIDTAEVNGGNGAEQFTVTANGTRVRFDRLSPAPFSLDIGTTENLVLNAGGGDDVFSATGNLAALIKLTIDGGAGNDTINGGNGNDLLMGGDGNDVVDGNQGSDVVLLGAGDDIFKWDPGDGSDVVEGQDGMDTLLFNGSAGSEIMQASANGERVLFTRNLGNIAMDLNDVERIDINALGGADQIIVNDLSGTDVTQVDVNLAGVIGGTAGDAQADTVIVNGTNGNDIIDVFGSGTSASVIGLAAQVNITGAEGANDSLVINGGDGNDGITATTVPAGVIKLTLDGGAGNDSILGSQGGDVILGGDGNDFVFGDNGNDVAFLGAGDDVFQWDPGDGNDVVEGQDGVDRLDFFGSNASENIDIVANGGRALLLRDVANVTMDLDDVERIELRTFGGADNIVIGDLSGTDIQQIEIGLRGPNGGGDGQADTITVNATNGDDVFGVAGDAGGITIFGLQAAITAFDVEVENDRLTLNGLGGDDVIDATSLEADGVQLVMNGGLGDDILIGSEGNDLVTGGDGNDLALLGVGDDTFVWNPGDDNDVVGGQAGFDTLQFNGANVSEIIDISANGGRALFTRNIASVVMDLDDVENVTFNALGGADVVVINDLTGTDVTEVNVNLAASNGAGDAQPDTVIANATNGDDVVLGVGDANGTSVLGLAAQINITGAEPNLDHVVINLLGGDDVFEGSALGLGSIGLAVDGGDGDDVIIGGAGNDTLTGGDGDDVILGGGGIDIIDGGAGDDIIIQGGGSLTVKNFEEGDRIFLGSMKNPVDIDSIVANAKEADGNVVIDFGGGDMITLLNFQVASLHGDDFLL